MKSVFKFGAMALLAVAALSACEKEKDPNNNGGTTVPTEKERLATPSLSVTNSTETSFTVEWGAVENADAYVYSINGSTDTRIEETSIEFTDLAVGVYEVKVKALAASGSEEYRDSNYGSITHEIEYVYHPAEPAEDLQPFLGVYSATSTGSVVFSRATDGVNMVYNAENPQEFDITMSGSDDPNYLFVDGLSGLGAGQGIYAYGTIVIGQTPEGETLEGFAIVAERDIPVLRFEDGSCPEWLTIAVRQDGSLTFVGGSQSESFSHTFILDEGSTDSYTSLPTDVTLADNTVASVVGTELAYLDGTTIYFVFADAAYPVTTPAGTLTMKKTGDLPAEQALSAASLNRMRTQDNLRVYAGEAFTFTR
ncbi:MAG TPA: hypothetical protein IAC03_01725 [Candidatus Coprenecus pullistercoris]|nr:hypothetical protein [Candidatus Coprenecus pullistercoris]